MNKIVEIVKSKNLIQFIKFTMIGASNTIVSYIAYILVIKLGGHYLLGNICGYIAGTLNAFVWNNRWVFKKEENEYRNLWIALWKMFISYAGTGIVLNNILLIFWIEFLNVPEILAPGINSVISLVVNFFINKYWIFKKGKKGND